MPVATVTIKGQVTIPAEVRRALGLRTGSRVVFVPNDAGSYEIVAETGTVRSLKGMVTSGSRPVSLDDMERAIGDGAVEGVDR